jgi:hypothetical protein
MVRSKGCDRPVGNDLVDDRRSCDLDIEVDGVLIPDQVRGHPRFQIASGREIGESEIEHEPRARGPREPWRVAATRRRSRQSERVRHAERVARPGVERHVEHSQLGAGTTSEVSRQHLPDGKRRAVEPDSRYRLAQVEHRPARHRSHDEGQRCVTARRPRRTIEDQPRVNHRDVDGDGRLPIEDYRRRSQVEIRGHGLSPSSASRLGFSSPCATPRGCRCT